MKYKSPAFEAVHSIASDLNQLGLIPKKRMQHFDKSCLTPVEPLLSDQIRAIREKENVSQTVFAHYLNVSSNLVSDWERGIKKPSGAALKLLTLVQHKGIDAIA
ncbi:helix-turn-helix domain-containing protein [Caviibacterium pharyngocola]|uniref:Transcriptional regulator n=1 Tax=Caviibacterium pharyngocola TaxID=28159 RepID=A0A2M8RX18_9PAST|nr:DNA-binding transcriptional regulator [Caviibacterium pharyngocola]PJG83437.1 transcriptional regulator [Caviibacterium pharyngocola]